MGDTPASIATSCGLTPDQLIMINNLPQEEEDKHRTLHSKADQEALKQQDAKKVVLPRSKGYNQKCHFARTNATFRRHILLLKNFRAVCVL